MNVKILNTFKVAARISLIQVASHFNFKQDAGWKEFIKIGSSELEKVFMYSIKDKYVYLYKYGCITFVNFKHHEIFYFFEYLSKIYVDIDNTMLSKFTDTYVLNVSDNSMVNLDGVEENYEFSGIMLDIISTVQAKSTEIHKIEAELNKVLDDAEKLINYLNKGRLIANSRNVISTIAQCTRFKYRTIESVRLLDRPPEFSKTIETRNLFNIVSKSFELDDRYLDMLNRMEVLDSITEEYFNFKHNQSEKRLLIFEIILLALFPIMYFIG
ncbi:MULTISPECIES: RMD1 family protein [unclassified Sedimentibacter]|uniref:RMD1 family protein n=1 Tax=unclassified Sedimentibacter TaxID=2649220 RepID=UPI0027E0C6DC|nr:RMD1 family protein [Sedimentibacter sp. MB35-C1]WMJ78846.1 RMD1 family protein [Sedimentibacter sp. MB35-C1]